MKMLVSHDLSAAIDILIANYYNQVDNKYKYNLHFFVPLIFWCLWFIFTLRTAVSETWIFLPCDFYRFYCFKYVGLCNNITIKKKNQIIPLLSSKNFYFRVKYLNWKRPI